MKAWGARQRAKAKLLFSFRKGGRITAKGRQLHYDLYRHRVAGNQHTNVVYDVLRFLGLTSRQMQMLPMWVHRGFVHSVLCILCLAFAFSLPKAYESSVTHVIMVQEPFMCKGI